MKIRSVLAELAAAPQRFRFDAAVRILSRAARTNAIADAMRFRTPPGLAYPPADVSRVRDGTQPEVTTAVMGLVGPSGVLPRHYTEAVVSTLRGRSTALYDFLDMLSHRFVAFFAQASTKYRPARAAEAAALRQPPDVDAITQVLLSLTGYGTANLTNRLESGSEPILHYAGLFAMRQRSAERLRAMVSDWLGRPVEVIEFAGAWLNLPIDQRTRIGARGAFNRLGNDAAAGVRAWDPQARFVLKVGPFTDAREFETFLPNRAELRRLVALVRAYVGYELGFGVNPVLAGPAVPPLQLLSAIDPAPRLGWNTWLPSGSGGRGDAADAVFEAEVIEAQNIVPKGIAA